MKCRSLMLVAALIFATATDLLAASVGTIQIKGIIGPATASYISRAIEIAASKHEQCLIIQLDTPGGLVSSTEEIVQNISDSKVPVVVYVSPSFGSATSAGTFITLAADIAAMAPNTRIGAAHPVSMGLGSSENTNDVMNAKAENDLASLVKNIAEKRGRNVKWAISAVRKSASITSEDALDMNVIDLIAKDIPDLLAQLDGREINGKELKTAGADVEKIPMVAREKVFQVLWRPEVMFLLMLVAIYGIIGEINHPGAILPGVVGAIALILFLYMSTILPINVAGVALIILSIVLFVVDVYAPTHGVLTAGGVVAFFLGAIMLFNRSPAFHLSLAWIIPATAITALFFLFIVGAGLRAQMLPVRAGGETMLGKIVPAMDRIDAQGGKVFIEGEYWNAVSDAVIEKDQLAEVVEIRGLTLKVKPKST